MNQAKINNRIGVLDKQNTINKQNEFTDDLTLNSSNNYKFTKNQS